MSNILPKSLHAMKKPPPMNCRNRLAHAVMYTSASHAGLVQVTDITIITTCHAYSCIGQQPRSSSPVCHWPAPGRCPSCGSFLLPQFFGQPHFHLPSGVQRTCHRQSDAKRQCSWLCFRNFQTSILNWNISTVKLVFFIPFLWIGPIMIFFLLGPLSEPKQLLWL